MSTSLETSKGLRGQTGSELGRGNVETLGQPATARQIAVTTTSANTQLTAGIGRISIMAVGAAMRYKIASSAPTASATTDHYIASGERLDIKVPITGYYIAAIRDSAATANGQLEITELAE